MYRVKDFYLKKVSNLNGKKLGNVKDIFIDFYMGQVKGLLVGRMSMMSKKNYVQIENVVNFDDEIIVNDIILGEGLKVSDIISMEVIDKYGTLKGVVEDILIDEENFTIKGIVVSPGIVDKLIYGKEILLPNQTILGEEYILYFGESNIVVKNIPHEINKYDYRKKA